MKIINVMNFVRYIDERFENSVPKLFETTQKELELVNEFGIDNTFLLQYDAYANDSYVTLFKEQATNKTEVGIWLEIVKPLCDACGLPYRSENGWQWDWHIIPGFSAGYLPHERELLIDEAMRKFKDVFGHFPKTVGSWLLDTHTVNYLSECYQIDAIAVCRDQMNTDAYTMIGGYFNGAYYPSKHNYFTPAQHEEMRVHTPVFRLLGPCPIHNFEGQKYLSDAMRPWVNVFTMEAVGLVGRTPEYFDAVAANCFDAPSLSYAYAQIGQENSFGLASDLIPPIKMQIEKLMTMPDVTFQKMGDTGAWFKKTYPDKTPAMLVSGLKNWDSCDMQAISYSSQHYTANLMRYEKHIILRRLFLFDETVKDHYMTEPCGTFDAVFENLPIIDNLRAAPEEKTRCGLVIDTQGTPLHVSAKSDTEASVLWDTGEVVFSEKAITIKAETLVFYPCRHPAAFTVEQNTLHFTYKNHPYRLTFQNAKLTRPEDSIVITPENGVCTLKPEREQVEN